jgi:hypothetical protein
MKTLWKLIGWFALIIYFNTIFNWFKMPAPRIPIDDVIWILISLIAGTNARVCELEEKG